MSFYDVAISFGGSVLLFILLSCIAIALTIFFYRTTIPPIPQRRKLLLAILRGCALTILVALAFEPLLKLLFQEQQDPVLAVLIDDSASMTIRDQSGERSTQVRDFLKNDPFAHLSPGIMYVQFASKLKKNDFFHRDSLRFEGETTDLSSALHQLNELRRKENIQAIMIISDGMYTVGQNPIAVVENFAIPVYTMGVGDTVDQRDILIAKVTTNNLVHAETNVPVDILIRSSGFKNEKVEVTLRHGTTVVDRKILQLQEQTRDYPVNLSYKPKDEGVQKYTVTVSHLPGELTERNNSRPFFVKVLKTKLKIALIAGGPSPDVSTVRQTLSEEQHFSLTTLIQKSSSEFYGGHLTPAMLDSADCLVLAGYPSTASTPAQLQLVARAIERTRKPVLFISSRGLDFELLRSFENILPFSWSVPSGQEILVFPEVAEKQRSHNLIQLNGDITAESWQQLPPIFKTQTVFRAKPESELLASVRIQSIVLNEPLVLTRNIARQKTFAVTGHGIWRWRSLTVGNPQTEKFLPLLLTSAVRWLTTIDEGKKVRVSPLKDIFNTAEPIEFTGEVYDEQLRPVENAEVRVSVTSQYQKAETMLRSIGSGRYEGVIEGVAAGDYTFGARATVDGDNLGEDRGKFSIGELHAEFLETKMNKQLLEQIAFRTNGLYADIAQAAPLIDSLSRRVQFTAKHIVHTSEIELWNWQYLAAALILLLGTEWYVRKRSGML